jgi:beta-galactosidase
MAVDRDRWIGAPIDRRGRKRPLAERYVALNQALEKVAFHTLTRHTPVRLVIPRMLRRLARVMHAFGSATPALFSVLGAGWRESVAEESLGAEGVIPMVAEQYVRAFERALLARGVPFAYAAGETLDVGARDAQWLICPTAGGMKPELLAQLRQASRIMRVTVGPTVPTRDGLLRELSVPAAMEGLELEDLGDLTRADALVARRVEELGLPTYSVEPEPVHVAVHHSADGSLRAAFVMNPSDAPVTCRIGLPGAAALHDLLDDRRVARQGGVLELDVPARTVRLFAVEHGSAAASFERASPFGGAADSRVS